MKKAIYLLLMILALQVRADDIVFEEGLTAFKTTLYPLLRERCIKCHGQGGEAIQHSSPDVTEAYLNSKELVDFNDPMKSIFYRRVKSQHWLKHDPTQQGMTESEILDGINRWWEAGEKNVVNSYQLQSLEVALPANLPQMKEGKWVTLSWNLELGGAYKGCSIQVDIQKASEATPDYMGSYRVRNPAVKCSQSSYRFTGLFFSVSNQIANYENIFKNSVAQSSMSSSYTSFSNEYMILLQRRRDQPDTLKAVIQKIEAL